MEEIPSEQKLTIAQIAAAAGVSVPTVSKVINKRSDVSPATRERVERVIAEKGYATNRVSVSLKKERKALVNLLVPSLRSPSSLEIIRGVEDALMQADIRLVLSVGHSETYHERQWINSVIDGSIDGIVLVLGETTQNYLQELRQHSVPFVVIDSQGELGPNIPSVGVTNWTAGRVATQHLLSLGHRRIGAILGPHHTVATRDRLAGYRTALEELNIPFDSSLIGYASFSLKASYKEVNTLLERVRPPTALLMGNDEQALGAYRALHDRGLTVPEDMSILGFDDTLLASQSTPPLTTMRQPLFEMGRTATSMLLRLTEGKQLDGTRVELATPLIERASCAPQRRARVLWDITTPHGYQWPLHNAKEA